MSKRKLESPKTLPLGKYVKGDSSSIEGLPSARESYKYAIGVKPEKNSYAHPEATAYNTESSYDEGIRPINVKSLVDAQKRGEVTQRIEQRIEAIREAIFNIEDKIKNERKKKKNERKKKKEEDLRIEKDGYKRRLKGEIENVKNERAMLDMDWYDTETYSRLLRQKEATLRNIIERKALIKEHKATIKDFPSFEDTYKIKIEELKKRLEEDTDRLEEIEDKIKKLFDDLYQYASQDRGEQLIQVYPRGGKKTRKRRSTKKRRKTKTLHKKDRTGQKNIKMND